MLREEIRFKRLDILLAITAITCSITCSQMAAGMPEGQALQPAEFQSDIFMLLSAGPDRPSKAETQRRLQETKFVLKGHKTSAGWRYTYHPIPPTPLFCAVLSSYLTLHDLKDLFVTYAHVTNLCSQLYNPAKIAGAFKKRFKSKETKHLERAPQESYFPTFFRRKSFKPLDFENAVTMARFIANHFDKSHEGGVFRSSQVLLGSGALMRFKLCAEPE